MQSDFTASFSVRRLSKSGTGKSSTIAPAARLPDRASTDTERDIVCASVSPAGTIEDRERVCAAVTRSTGLGIGSKSSFAEVLAPVLSSALGAGTRERSSEIVTDTGPFGPSRARLSTSWTAFLTCPAPFASGVTTIPFGPCGALSSTPSTPGLAWVFAVIFSTFGAGELPGTAWVALPTPAAVGDTPPSVVVSFSELAPVE
mmetsp:Transcript_9891/g.24901  ORF Transcript_9891/g.24901 Transcript_9891/m.24901 type:complete len:202 (+) Transcript_9891:195-800(+)